MVLIIRLVFEKCHEWGWPLVILKADIRVAFDYIHPKASMNMMIQRHFSRA